MRTNHTRVFHQKSVNRLVGSRQSAGSSKDIACCLLTVNGQRATKPASFHQSILRTTLVQLRWLLVMSGWLLTSGCHDDFLDRPPEDTATLDNFYATDAQVRASSAILYGSPWFDFNDKANWMIGDVMAGNHWTNDGEATQFFVFGVNGDNPYLNQAWSSLWGVVSSANAVIANVPRRAGANVSPEIVEQVVAEAKFIRAVAYFYLVRLWGSVPIIENNDDQLNNPIIPRHRVEDGYYFIMRDLKEAAYRLPAAYPAEDAGRVTRWSAQAMLAKVYLTRAGYGQAGSRLPEYLDSARTLAQDVLTQSGLSLRPDYRDLFRVEYENSDESLFAFQWTSCQEWGTQNTHQAYFAPDGAIAGVGDGWGGYNGPTIDLQNAYEAGDRRRDVTIMMPGAFYPELLQKAGGYTYTVDPADDDGENATFAAVKKYVIGSAADNGVPVCFMSTPLNTYVQRLADVYLIYAEAILGNQPRTADPEALNAVNQVRGRAGLPPLNSLTLDDILHERRVEFAYEAEYWYDMVRMHYFEPAKAVRMASEQERGTRTFGMRGEWIVNSRHVEPTSADFTLPYPSGEVEQNPKLGEDPVPYDF